MDPPVRAVRCPGYGRYGASVGRIVPAVERRLHRSYRVHRSDQIRPIVCDGRRRSSSPCVHHDPHPPSRRGGSSLRCHHAVPAVLRRPIDVDLRRSPSLLLDERVHVFLPEGYPPPGSLSRAPPLDHGGHTPRPCPRLTDFVVHEIFFYIGGTTNGMSSQQGT